MKKGDKNEIKSAVRSYYARMAAAGENPCSGSECCSVSSSGKRNSAPSTSSDISKRFTYFEEDICEAPAGSYLGLGCGNPLAGALLKPGETVLDLGSGAGFDCFLALKQVGEGGHVIGVDMTPEMVRKARENSEGTDCGNIEFRLGELENLPVADSLVDVVISNCVINLSTDKQRVFAEAFRVLKEGGRLMIMDMVASIPIPDKLRKDTDLYCHCISGAAEARELEEMLKDVGFAAIQIHFRDQLPQPSVETVGQHNVRQLVVPAAIQAYKPGLLHEKYSNG